jgi:two-component system, OmpR family, sensor histidine kinase KdpD
MSRTTRQHAVGAHVALPAAFAGMLLIGTLAAALHGRFSATGVLVAVALLVAVTSAAAEPRAAPLLALIGWLTVVGFSRPPYAQLRPTGPLAAQAAVTLAACGLVAAGTGMLARQVMASVSVRIVRSPGGRWPGPASPPGAAGGERGGAAETPPAWLAPDAPAGIDRRRQVTGALLAAAVLPLLTAALALGRPHLSLDDDLLIYLVAVVAVAIAGGFWPAVLAAIAASLLLNWFFTPPLHTFTIDTPQNLLALLLFVTVAVTVSSVVHLAARRAGQAARSGREAASLLALAHTVLGGGDTVAAVLGHLTGTAGGRAELLEHVRGQWVQIAASGAAAQASAPTRVSARQGLVLVVAGQPEPAGPRLLDGFAAQAAAALDRERLRTQAAQAEALAEGNRMRNALLAAVSHDLRTPLAAVKASVSTLRQQDVAWTEDDQAALLATIEQSADRLDALIGNLLDMGRLAAASLQPFLAPAAVDEVAPLALRGLDQAAGVQLLVPDALPLVLTDPGLLERVLANLFANALAYSPPDRPPAMRAHRDGDTVVLEVTDHGRGVPDEWKQRIFEPFQRRGPTPGTGVGLGLAVAKGLAEAMGATLEAADTPGGGLTMRLILRVAGKAASSALLADR